jgi:type II secretory pathway pseudopilin PulG
MRKIQLHKQSGLTLLEVIVALGIMASIVAGLAYIAESYGANMRTSVVGQQAATFANGFQKYVDDNYSAISAVATATTPAIVTVNTLIAAGPGYLPAGFNSTNTYGQTMCGLVLQPTAGKLQAVATTEGGTAINDLDLGQIAGVITNAGVPGGGIYTTAPTAMRGAMGGWNTPIGNYSNANNAGTHCDGTAGTVVLSPGHPVIALWFQGGDQTAGVLYRNAIPGAPQLNQMNTPIVMSSVQTTGNVCTTLGAIAQNGSGAILSCQPSSTGNVWTLSGDGKCVFTAADLNTMQTDGRCFNGSGNANSPAGADWFFLEVYRHVNQSNYYTAQRVVGMTGAAVGRVWQRNQQSASSGAGWGAWIQQADSQVSISAGGNVTAAGTVSAGRIQSAAGGTGGAGQAGYDVAGSQIAANKSIYSYGTICSQNSAGDCSGTGGTIINGQFVNTGYVTANEFVLSQGNTANSPCWPNGAIGLEASTGNMLQCKATWWRRIGQLNMSYWQQISANGQTDLGWHSLCTLTGVTDANAGGVTQFVVGPFGSPSYPDGYWHWYLTNNSNGGQAIVICYQNN